MEGLVIAETPYRQAAGLIEVALKQHISDRTNWRKMLTNDIVQDTLESTSNLLMDKIPEELKEYIVHRDKTIINFPVLSYPEKVSSLKLEKTPIIEEKLIGIKGQYLIFEQGKVINLRSHAGYLVSIE